MSKKAIGISLRGRLPKLIIYFSFWCIALVALINATKVPDNDLIWYLEAYARGNGKTTVEYWPESGRYDFTPLTDFGYFIFCWIISNLANGNPAIFIIANTIFSYTFYVAGVVNFSRYLNVSSGTLIVSIVIACFYPYIFTNSANILRQFDAGSIMFYIMSCIPLYDKLQDFVKRNWWGIVLMFLFHKSALFFVVLSLLGVLRKNFREKPYIGLGIFLIVALYQVMASQALSVPFISNSMFSLVLERASEDTTVELEHLSILEYITIIFLFVIFFYNALRKNISGGLRHVLHIFMLLSFFILKNTHQLELCRRFYMYLLFSLPLAFMLICKQYPVIRKLNPIFMFSTIFVWYLYTKVSLWDYRIPYDLLLSPIFLYDFNQNF